MTLTSTMGILCAAIHAACTADRRGSAFEEGLQYFAATRGHAATRPHTWIPFDHEGLGTHITLNQSEEH